MTTKTREEAIETADKEMIMLIKNGDTISGYNIEKTRVVFYRGSIENSWTFTPAKPEFEKGTIGLDADSSICFYKILNSCGDYVVCLYSTSLDGVGGYTTETFTPIYQTDPIEKRAFELACEVLYRHPNYKTEGVSTGDARCTELGCIDQLKAHFKSKAKEELSK